MPAKTSNKRKFKLSTADKLKLRNNVKKAFKGIFKSKGGKGTPKRSFKKKLFKKSRAKGVAKTIVGPADNDIILKTRVVGKRSGRKPNVKGAMIKQMMDQMYPVVRQHVLNAPNTGTFRNLEWGAGFQSVEEIQIGYDTNKLRLVLDLGNAAQYQWVNTSSPPANGIPNVFNMTDQKCHVYSSTYNMNYKNVSTHTSYLELRVYKVKGYHGYTFLQTWNEALNQINMLPEVLNTLSNTIDQEFNDPGNRPKMSQSPELYTRFTEMKSWRQKYVLSPGQSMTYKIKLPEFRFSKAEFNVRVGGFGSDVDPSFNPHSYFVVAFAQAEMVSRNDDSSVNRAVTCGSGRIDVNYEYWDSCQAIPYIKPLQTGFAKFWKELGPAEQGDMDEQAPQDVTYDAI